MTCCENDDPQFFGLKSWRKVYIDLSYAEGRYASLLSIVLLSVSMLNVIMLCVLWRTIFSLMSLCWVPLRASLCCMPFIISVIVLSDYLLIVIMIINVLLCVIMLSVVILIVVTPCVCFGNLVPGRTLIGRRRLSWTRMKPWKSSRPLKTVSWSQRYKTFILCHCRRWQIS